MEKIAEPFEFMQCINIVLSTGKKANSLHELRDVIAIVSPESIFHHSCQYFLKGHVLDYTNDFAQWAGEGLEERALSEHLSNIDSYSFREINNLRGELIRVIDNYMETFPEPRKAMPGDEFYFNETITLVFPIGIRAKNLAEFHMAIKYIDAASIYYHFYESRTRLGGEADDFSRWFDEALGKKKLADHIGAIDLFMHSIEGIREHIVRTVEDEVKMDMEFIGSGG